MSSKLKSAVKLLASQINNFINTWATDYVVKAQDMNSLNYALIDLASSTTNSVTTCILSMNGAITVDSTGLITIPECYLRFANMTSSTNATIQNALTNGYNGQVIAHVNATTQQASSGNATYWLLATYTATTLPTNNSTAQFTVNYQLSPGATWDPSSQVCLAQIVINSAGNNVYQYLQTGIQNTSTSLYIGRDFTNVNVSSNFKSQSISDNGVLTFNQRPNFANSKGATIDDFSLYFYLINLQDIQLGAYSKLFPNQNLPAFPVLVSQQNLQVFNVVTGRVKFLQYPYTSGALFEMQLSYYIGDIINNGNFILQFQAFNTATSKLQNSVYNVFSLRYNTYNTTTGTTQFLIDVISDPSNPTKNWATGGSHPFSQIQFRVYETSSGIQTGRIELTIQASLT